MKLHIKHTTDYRYTEPLRYALQTLWLTPLSGPGQTVNFWSLGAPEKLFAQSDAFGNSIHSYTFVGEVADNVRWSLVNAAGHVETLGVAEFTDAQGMPLPQLYLRESPLARPHPGLAEFGRRFIPAAAPGGKADLQAILALAAGVAGAVSYQKNSTNVTTTAQQAFESGAGVCQDQAHVMVAVCRSLGIPARYVSGYFYAANEPDLASHAWADVCLDVAGRRWVSIDVTHSCMIDERHVRLAMGTDYSACPPSKGVRHGGGEESMTVSITIEPA
ncbi:MAG: Protein containing transglutaminase-like domain, putative cysteine protease [Polaromonas sp.]|jgi:transglutaminase-like putative cysteine protease|nr:Protein containing transglutaminase-like domain, putative cysteine protease [Polaromonas sp.]